MSDIIRDLRSGDRDQKIRILESLASTGSSDVIEEVILRLDDDDIRVRGEAFSSLILNENDISGHLLRGLGSASTNIRGFASLVLANRGEASAVPYMVKLASDERPMVRSCAVGALGHLRAAGGDARDAILGSLFDQDLDVRKSAAHAATRTGMRIDRDEFRRISDAWAPDIGDDSDLRMLLGTLQRLS